MYIYIYLYLLYIEVGEGIVRSLVLPNLEEKKKSDTDLGT